MRRETIFITGLLMLSSSAALADPAGDAVFARCLKVMQSTQSVQAKFHAVGVGSYSHVAMNGEISLRKPNVGKIEISTNEPKTPGANPIRRYSDGHTVYYEGDNKRMFLEDANPDGKNLLRDARCDEANFFIDPTSLQTLRSTGTGMNLLGDQMVGNLKCKVLELAGAPSGLVYRLYIDEGGFVVGADAIVKRPGRYFGLKSRLSDVAVDKAEPATPTGPPESPTKAPMLALPATLALKRLNGRTVSLAAAIKHNRVTILSFCSLACKPCPVQLTALDARFSELKSKGIGVWAIDLKDAEADFRAFAKSNGLHMDLAIQGELPADALGISEIPTSLVVDSHGKIIETISGNPDRAVAAALDSSSLKIRSRERLDLVENAGHDRP